MGKNGGLKEYYNLCSRQIDDIVRLVRGKLTKMARTTLGALIVLDVHGKVSDCVGFSWNLSYTFFVSSFSYRIS